MALLDIRVFLLEEGLEVKGLPQCEGSAWEDAWVGAAGEVHEDVHEGEGEIEKEGQSGRDCPIIAVHEHDIGDEDS